MSTMTQPLSYEIITPGGYVMDKITHKARCNKVSFPYGIYGYHALTFLKNWMRTAKEK